MKSTAPLLLLPLFVLRCAGQTETAQAHDSVMKFMQGIKLAALPEGKKLMAESQWIVGPADRGENYYARPSYTDSASIYAGMFETDVPRVNGYKELFDMKAVTKAGITRSLKFLVLAFKDTDSGKWKVLSAIDDEDNGADIDIDHQITGFRELLHDTHVTSARENYAAYADWLIRAGRIREAKAAYESAKAASTRSDVADLLKRDGDDPVRDLQIDFLLDVIQKIAPQPTLGKP